VQAVTGRGKGRRAIKKGGKGGPGKGEKKMKKGKIGVLDGAPRSARPLDPPPDWTPSQRRGRGKTERGKRGKRKRESPC